MTDDRANIDEKDVDESIPAAETASFSTAVGWSFAMNAVQLAANLGTAFLFAALLGPEAFGIVAMALLYVTFLQILVQQGLVPAIVQRHGLTRRHLDSAFWLTLGVSLILTCVSILLAGWWGAINGAADGQVVIQVLSVLVAVKGLVVVPEALLIRQLGFRQLAIRTAAASLVGASVGITWMLVEPSLWAVVAQQIVAQAVAAIALWAVTSWRPRLRFWRREASQLLSFAGKATLSSIAVFVNGRLDAILVGVFFGPTAIGLYRLADRLVESVVQSGVQPIQTVALGDLSKHQRGSSDPAHRYRLLVATTTAIGAPMMAVVFACARPLMSTLGDEWVGAATALQLLCVVGLVRSMTLVNSPAVLAAGRPGAHAAMVWFAAAVSSGVFVVAGFALQGQDTSVQVFGMATSRAMLYVMVLLPVSQLLLIRPIVGVGFRQFLGLVAAPLLVAAVAAGVGSALANVLASTATPAPVALIAVGLFTIVVYAPLALAFSKHTRFALSVAKRRVTGRGRAAAIHSLS